jgi:hypothetical protein
MRELPLLLLHVIIGELHRFGQTADLWRGRRRHCTLNVVFDEADSVPPFPLYSRLGINTLPCPTPTHCCDTMEGGEIGGGESDTRAGSWV